jgi:hypothetical protein
LQSKAEECQKGFSLLFTAMPFASVNYGSDAAQAPQFVTLQAAFSYLSFSLPQTRSLQPVPQPTHFASRHVAAIKSQINAQRRTYLFAKPTHAPGFRSLAS